jgi:hypothetical protein
LTVPGDVAEVGTDEQISRLPAEQNRTLPVTNGVQAGLSEGQNGMRLEKATGFSIRHEAEEIPDGRSKKKVAFLKLQDEYINPRTSNQRKVEIASMLYSLGG